MADLLPTEIAQTIAEKLYDEIPPEACDRCAYFEEASGVGVCSLAVFEESMCPIVRARLIQTRDSIIALLPPDISEL